MRSNSEAQPGTEEEIRVVFEEVCEIKKASIELANPNFKDYITSKNSVDGQYHEFNFDVEINDDEQIVLRYRPEM